MIKIPMWCNVWSVVLTALVASGSLMAETFVLPSQDADIVGRTHTVFTRQEDTLADIAQRHGVGYEEIILANQRVDPWLPGKGTQVVLPVQYVLPPTPREGIVINLPEMRLYYYPQPRPGEKQQVVTYPVGIGRMDWNTPLGLTKVMTKIKNPVWRPPLSIREEHAARGNILPAVVPPGPDNPLGGYALRLTMPGYLIHGTDKPAGIGMRVTHGCIRLNSQDIETLFNSVPVGTPVRIINEPYKAGWLGGMLYVEAHPPLEEDNGAYGNNLTPLVRAIVGATQERAYTVDWGMARAVAEKSHGIPLPVLPLTQEARR